MFFQTEFNIETNTVIQYASVDWISLTTNLPGAAYVYNGTDVTLLVSNISTNKFTNDTVIKGDELDFITDDNGNVYYRVLQFNVVYPTRPQRNSAPVVIEPVSIYGNVSAGDVLTVSYGEIEAYPTETLSQEWFSSSDGGLTWNPYVPAELGTTYTLTTADEGNLVKCTVTAMNIEGTIVVDSNWLLIPVSSGPSLCGPVISGVLAITGVKIVGQVLTCSVSGLTVTGSPTPTPSYQWYRGANPISGATSLTYTLVAADTGESIWMRATYTSTGGVAYVDSDFQFIYLTIADKYPTGAAHGWNVFLLKGSYYGSPLMEVRRASDNTTQLIYSDVNGYLDIASIISFCGTSQGFVRTYYDQLGGQHLVQTNTTLQLRIYTGTAIEFQNLIAAMNAQATTALMTVPGSAAAGTFNFLHDGTTNFTIFSVTTASNNPGNILTTQTGTNIGTTIQWTLNNGFRNACYNAAAGLVVSQTTPNSTITLNKQYGVMQICSLTSAIANQRMRSTMNDLFLSTNGQGGVVSTNNASTDLQIGGGGVFRYQCLILYKTHTNAFDIRAAIVSQFNIAM